ncbi:MAG: hypothetical protein NTW87_02855 [Planctomycetota bacterium]|nr:hypothetical protein [Planctomycetota bacterium]
MDKDALSSFGLSRAILDLGKVTFGDRKLDKDSWAQAAPQLKFAANIIGARRSCRRGAGLPCRGV